jgi:hypothetical protein
VNVEWGIVLLVFAAIMLGLGYRADLSSRPPGPGSRPADPADSRG